MKSIQTAGPTAGGTALDVEVVQLARARDGDRQAQTWLVECHQDAVYGLAFRLTGGDSDRAEELAQEAFLRALRALPRFRGDSAFGTWMHRIVVNLHINRESTLAAKARRRTAPIQMGSAEDGERSGVEVVDADRSQHPTEVASRREERILIDEALAELDEDRRTVVVLRDLEGLSYDEIAEQLHVPIGTVRSRLFRAREQLRERLLKNRPELAEESRTSTGKVS